MNTLRRSPSHASPWRWAVGGASVGLVLALVLFAPARWMGTALEQATAGHVRLAAPRGTVWDGSAQLVLTGGRDSRDAATLPDRVTWTVRPGWGHVSLHLGSACCTPQPLHVRAQPRWGGVQVDVLDGSSRWPAAVLAGLGTPWNTLQPQGTLALSTRAFTLELVQGRLTLGGQAELQAQAISSSLCTLKPMGSYRLTLQGGPTSTLQLDTLEGSLQLSGSGQWVDSRLHFQGTASAQPEHVDALSNLLNIIGRRNGARSVIQVG